MSNLTVENVYTRHQAKLLAKKHFWKLLGMMLIVLVIAYGISFGGMALLNYGTASNLTLTTSDAVSAVNATGSGVVFWLGYALMLVVNMLVSGGLGLGLTSAMLDICRGDENVTVGRVFSRMKHCLKALGLSLWVGLKTVLWALPVYALGAVAIVFILTSLDGEASAAAQTFLTLLPLLLMVLVFALVIPAVYRYLLSTYILADKPETGIRACVNESKALMKGHKWQAFKLVVPTVLILYGLMVLLLLAFTLLTSLLAEISEAVTVIVSVVFIIALLVLAMYYVIRMGLGYCIFYLNRQNKGVVEEPAAESAAE